MTHLIPILSLRQSNLSLKIDEMQTLNHLKSGLTITYMLKNIGRQMNLIQANESSVNYMSDNKMIVEKIDYFSFLYEALEILQEYNLIK